MKHLIGIQYLPKEEILSILDLGDDYKKKFLKDRNSITKNLKDTILITLFFEPSTRTRMSFEIAAQLLGAEVINFSENVSSIQKGESRLDTLKTIEAMGANIVIIRSNIPGLPLLLTRYLSKISIINAGDGSHEHPSQALLDAMTIREHFKDLSKVRLAIVGDILFSRVARSNIFLLRKFGNENITVFGPTTLVPKDIEHLGTNIGKNLSEVIENSDVIMLLRIQTERQNAAFIPSLREYKKFWGITTEKLASVKDRILIMHPGPANREIEISSDVIYCDNSLILNQVTNGIATRMSILSHISRFIPAS